ncbi:transporter substrate-binding domain-containing protein [Melghirimyces algeriensis]|uniref:Cystine transport system substrate-binding protein n=1 Tax=Melghirimyces algeriensis TaxID=910412 RepID=A0A521ACE6_9BACL|nr:transporter substrate-binding domain-containing protein [Melghirimyces algeriensis]SMO32504.1 cystine transport system substrate-binding protein [Melghirimyces algeriensis]
MKRLFAMLLAVMSMVVLSACGSGGDESTANDSDALQEIKERGTLRIGTEGTYKPFSFRDEKTDKLTGYDVEVAREIAKRMGVKAEFVESPWDSMLTGLQTERFDTVANQVGITEERKEKFDYSRPYTVSYSQIVVHKDNDSIQSLEDIKGKRAGQTPTSNYGKMAKKAGAKIVAYEDMMTSMRDVAAKRVDLSINDRLAIAAMMKETDLPLKTVKMESEKAQMAFPVNKGNESLKKELDRVLKEMEQDGTLAKISKKWFGEDVSK